MRCELESPLVSSLTVARLGLWPYGLAIAAFPLVSRPWTGLCWSHLLSFSSVSVRSWFYRASFGSGVCSPASPICPTSSVLKRSSFGISASVFTSSLHDGVTLPGRACLSPQSERRSRWCHPFRVVWRFSAPSIRTKASSVHLSFVASRWGHPAGRVCFSRTRS